MLEKVKQWFYHKFLPEYARQKLLEENERLRRELAQREQRIRDLENYLDGVRSTQRAMRRISIYNNNGKGAV